MKPYLHCNTCSKVVEFDKMLGSNFLGARCCSIECIREYRLREACSILKKDYEPSKEYTASKEPG